MKLSLRNKFLIPTIALIIIGMGASAILSYWYSKTAIEKMAKNEIRQLAGSTVKQTDTWLMGIKLNLSSWSEEMTFKTAVSDSYLGESARESASERLLTIKNKYRIFENFILVNIKGEPVASDNIGKVGKLNFSGRLFFQESVKGTLTVSKVQKSMVTNNPVILVSAPVMQYEEKIEGVLIGIVSMEYFNNTFIKPLKTSAKGYAYVYDADGIVIAHKDDNKILKMNIKDFDFGQEMLKNKKNLISYTFQGADELAVFMKTQSINWSVAVAVNAADLLAPARNIGFIIFFFTIFVVIFAGCVIFFIAWRITMPLGAEPDILSRIAQKIARGELDFEFQDNKKGISGVYANMKQMGVSLEKKAHFAQQIADGDLTGNVTLSSEKDVLGKALQKMTSSLISIISLVNEAARQVATGAGQISGSSQTLSRNAAEQAASFEQITTSMIQIGAQTRANAENASQANLLASQAREAAEYGKDEMANMISAMENINEASQAIAKIIKAIDEIAFQTNLLSLNAAVEAARAGRHGKGFAVVAEEVRNLAGRSAKAAKETADLIEGAVKKVENGNEIAGQAAEALNMIVDASIKASDLIDEIAASSNEQAQAIDQVNQGLGQVDQVTQQNTGNAEETASAAEELSSQAAQLQHILARFKLKEKPVKTDSPKAPVFQKRKRDPKPRLTENGYTVKPEDVIFLDDDEFGKY